MAMILRLDQGGQISGWMTWQEAILHYAREQVVWTLGQELLRFHGGINRERNVRTYMDVHPIVAVRGKARGSIFNATPPLCNRELFRRDGHTCMYCLQVLPERHLTRDHVLPLSRGGRDVWTNVVAACKMCNQRKADRMLHEINMPLHATPYTPNYAEWLILSNRYIMADQMEFLRARCPKRNQH